MVALGLELMFSTAVITSAGGRTYNQDCAGHRTLPCGACWVVADGLGGHRGGETAASIAVNAVLTDSEAQPFAVNEESVTAWIESANARILAAQRDDPTLADMRTTVAVLASDHRHFGWCHVGDSRVYAVQQGRIVPLTKDHSVPQAMCDAGEITPEQVRFHEDRSRLLRALGAPSVKPSWSGYLMPVREADAFLLCTDGFWEHCTEIEMEAEYVKSPDPDEWLARMEGRVRARASGEYDNYTAVAVFVNHAQGEGA